MKYVFHALLLPVKTAKFARCIYILLFSLVIVVLHVLQLPIKTAQYTKSKYILLLYIGGSSI